MAVPSPSVPPASPASRGARWNARRIAAAGLAIGLMAIPVLVAASVALLASKIASPPSGWGLVFWWAVVFVASALAAAGADRLLRRFLPLVGLLRLALLFPADVPSRLGLALRAGTVGDLERGTYDLRDSVRDDPTEAAAQIVAFASRLQQHDRFTRGHSERVRAYASLLAAELGLSKAEREKLRWAALLHDIGKLEVRAELLNKPAALDRDEWLEMREHAAAGGRLGEPLRPWLGSWVGAIGEHHERYDGSGYPLGLSAEDISLAGRITAVADSYETMTARRPYKKPMSHDWARAELVAQAGGHFDPVVVRAMLGLSVRRLRWAAGPFAAVGDSIAAQLIRWLRPVDGMRFLPVTAAMTAVVAGTSLVSAHAGTPTEVPLPPAPAVAEPAPPQSGPPAGVPASVDPGPAPDPSPAPAPGPVAAAVDPPVGGLPGAPEADAAAAASAPTEVGGPPAAATANRPGPPVTAGAPSSSVPPLPLPAPPAAAVGAAQPAKPEASGTAVPALPAAPAVPGVSPAVPAVPAVPALPALENRAGKDVDDADEKERGEGG